MLGRLGEKIGKRMDPDSVVAPVYKQGSRGRWRWLAYYLPADQTPPETTEEARERKLVLACLCPVNGYSTRDEARAACEELLNVHDE